MKVLHVSIFDRHGGACIASYRQHRALRLAGIDSEIFVRFKVTNDPFVHEFIPPSDWRVRIPRIVRRKSSEWRTRRARLHGEMFTAGSEHSGSIMQCLPHADLINIQFSWDFLDYPSFFSQLPSHTPIVVTMHEMSTFTGGCSYAESCEGFLNRCGNCPKLGHSGEKDLSRRGWIQRHDVFSSRARGMLHFVADSRWLQSEAQRSSLLKKYPISTIHYGLNCDIFKPLNRIFARSSFGISEASRVVSFAAASVTDPRKGIRFLVEALQRMQEKPFLLTWGRSVPKELSDIPQLHLGNIESEHLMALAYNASDVFVMPSLEEAFGQTALESIACGTPVAAFNAGGIPETVRHEATGLLCPVGNSEALGASIKRLLGDVELWRHCSENGPQVARTEFSYEVNARNYIRLYQSLLKKSK